MVPTTPAATWLNLAGRSLAGVRRDLAKLTDFGEAMARPMLEGGAMFSPAIAKFWPSEFGGRAGGLLGLRPSDWPGDSRQDVAYFALPDPRRWDPRRDERLAQLVKSKARLFVIGRPEELDALDCRGRFAGFTGGAGPDAGLFGIDGVRPLAPLRLLEQLVRGWSAAGEYIGACTRVGRMPTIWMSVWLEGAIARNASFTPSNNLREPWRPPMFHDQRYIPPLPPGYAAGAYLDFLQGILKSLQGQLDALARAGEWIAQAKRKGRRAWVVAVGHSYPQILERPEKGYPLEWGPSYSDLNKALPHDLGPGDVALHLGYAPVDVGDVAAILRRGVRLIHTSPYGRPAALKDHKNLLWFDLGWRPGDACVDVPGYGVRIIPSSSAAHTLAYMAILCETAQLVGWK